MNDIDGVVKQLRALYKEIYPKLKDDEKQVYGELCEVILKAQALPADITRMMGALSKGKILFELEQVDIKLRYLADKHGLLMTNKEDPRFAALKT